MYNSEELLKKRKEIKSIFQDTQVNTLLNLIDPNKKVLEIGCGYGFFSEQIGKYSQSLTCVDPYLEIASSILKTYPQIKYLKNNGVALPFPDSEFDIVYSVDVIEHVERDDQFIKESLRVLKENGILIVGTPNKNRLSAQIKKLLFKPNKYPLEIKDLIFGSVTHIREYTRKELMLLIKNYNILVEKVIPLYFGFTEPLSIGFRQAPFFLSELCQFWFIKIRKK